MELDFVRGSKIALAAAAAAQPGHRQPRRRVTASGSRSESLQCPSAAGPALKPDSKPGAVVEVEVRSGSDSTRGVPQGPN